MDFEVSACIPRVHDNIEMKAGKEMLVHEQCLLTFIEKDLARCIINVLVDVISIY